MERIVFISHSSKDKVVADAIVHRLEENGIRCWIAPRDISSSDWATDIMDALPRCEVFVVIISHNANESEEIIKEVTQATHFCTYILPFRIEEEMLSKRLQYHLGPCHWLDAVTPPLEEHIDALIYRIKHLSEKDAVYANMNRMKLVEKISSPCGFFRGREKEIEALADAFKEEHIVFLQGMGGIGKSEIARGYAEAHRSEYDTIIFTSYTSNLMDLFEGDDITIENLRRADGEDGNTWFRRKLAAFRTLATPRTLLIIDNFDTDEDPYMDEVFASSCHILVTTRNDHSDYSTIHVGPIMDFDAVRRIFSDHYGKPIRPSDQQAVDEMLRLVGCHTITVELIAKQMKASFLKPEKMLERLRSTGVNTHLKEKVRRERSSEKLSAFDYIRQLFTFSGLGEEQRHMLSVMSLVPVSGIQVPMLGEILDLDDYDVINDLVGRSWLMLGGGDPSDDSDDIVRMHPVVRDVVRTELNPTPVNCLDYTEGLGKKSYNMWFFDLKEKHDFYALVRQIIIDWPVPVPETLNAYGHLINAAWMAGDFIRSQTFGEGVYNYALNTYGAADHATGQAALYVAGAYHNAGNETAAELWYRKAYEHLLEAGGPVTAALGQACFKVGRCALMRGDLEAAQPYYDKAVELYEDLIARKILPPGRIYPDQYNDLLHDLARLERMKGNYEKSIELEQECCDNNLKQFGRETVAAGYYYLGMGICWSKMGDYAKADEYMGKTLKLFMDHLGPASLQTMECREAIADSLQARGDWKGASTKLEEMLLDLGKYFGENNPLTIRIREKLSQ